MEREVIVVGAGPGGSSTAMALAQMGHDVLLLDRQSFPRDKVCGDAIPAGAIARLYDLGMKERIQAADFYPIDKLRLVAPNGDVLDADLDPDPRGADSYVVPRLEFDAVLQQHAVDSGAEFLKARVKGPILEDGKVTGVQARVNGTYEDIHANVVVAADGVTSSIARALRPDKHEDGHRAVALRAYVEDLEELPHQVEFYLYDDILPGYAWIFPIDKHRANVGLGMRLDKFRERDRSLEEMLQAFLDMPEIKKRLKNGGELHDVGTWQLNFGSQKDVRRAYDGALLVGDAAGLINPLTGGGIHNAITSAQHAAETIHQAIERGDFTRQTLQMYDEYCHDELWSNMRRSYYVQVGLIFFPFLVNWLIKIGGSNSEIAKTFMSKL